ncbi:hypothetical protein ACOMHN_054560 [Nucella lapillus]
MTLVLRYECSHCNRRFSTERMLREHMRRHVNTYKCHLCEMTCPSPSALRMHIRYKHSDEKPFKCGHCEFSAKSSTDLRKHLDSHNVEDQFSCHIANCPFSARSYNSLALHFKKHHESMDVNIPRYICHVCKRVFARGFSLTHHLKTKHQFQWPPGHSRFRYKLHEDGFLHLQTVRYECADLEGLPSETGDKAASKSTWAARRRRRKRIVATTMTRPQPPPAESGKQGEEVPPPSQTVSLPSASSGGLNIIPAFIPPPPPPPPPPSVEGGGSGSVIPATNAKKPVRKRKSKPVLPRGMTNPEAGPAEYPSPSEGAEGRVVVQEETTAVVSSRQGRKTLAQKKVSAGELVAQSLPRKRGRKKTQKTTPAEDDDDASAVHAPEGTLQREEPASSAETKGRKRGRQPNPAAKTGRKRRRAGEGSAQATAQSHGDPPALPDHQNLHSPHQQAVGVYDGCQRLGEESAQPGGGGGGDSLETGGNEDDHQGNQGTATEGSVQSGVSLAQATPLSAISLRVAEYGDLAEANLHMLGDVALTTLRVSNME